MSTYTVRYRKSGLDSSIAGRCCHVRACRDSLASPDYICFSHLSLHCELQSVFIVLLSFVKSCYVDVRLTMPTWLIVGASRGIGLEFVRQLLERGDQVIATVRDPERAADLWRMAGAAPRGQCRFLLCDVASDEQSSVCFISSDADALSHESQTFVQEIEAFRPLDRLDYVVMNAGMLKFPCVRRNRHPAHYTGNV